jgi:cobalamin synthase
MSDVFTIISSYYAILMILLLPVFAFITRIPFKKQGHNYYEHIVMNSYVVSYYTLISILVMYPILFLFRQNPEK